MNKAILVIDMPSYCYECFALDDSGDYPSCRITQEQRGYTFKTGEQRMDKCPLKSLPEKYDLENVLYTRSWDGEYECGYNACIDEILST